MLKFIRFIALASCIALSACSKDDNSAHKTTQLAVSSATDGKVIQMYNVEVTDTKEKMYTGLMGRTSLDKDSSFLFDISIVPQDMEVAMWMKDTLIPLDMLFVDENGVIFSIHENAQPNDTTPIYPPKRPRAVLEINGGQAKSLNIQVGDLVQHPLFDKK